MPAGDSAFQGRLAEASRFVGRYRTQSEAAEALGMSQSALSKTLSPKTTSEGRLASLEGAIARRQLRDSKAAPHKGIKPWSAEDADDNPERKKKTGPPMSRPPLFVGDTYCPYFVADAAGEPLFGLTPGFDVVPIRSSAVSSAPVLVGTGTSQAAS